MYSKSLVSIIARCGGFFTTNMLDHDMRKGFLHYSYTHDFLDIISTSQRANLGYVYKIKDELMIKYHPFNGRKKTILFTTRGIREFQWRIRNYIKEHKLHNNYSRHVNKEWYQKIYTDVIGNSEFFRATRYKISDYILFRSFAKILFWFETGILLYAPLEEEKMCSHLPNHKMVTPGISYGYNFATKKDVVFIADFMKSEKSLVMALEFYNSPRFEIYIYSFRPAKLFADKLHKKFLKEGNRLVDFKVLNSNELNKFFGEY